MSRSFAMLVQVLLWVGVDRCFCHVRDLPVGVEHKSNINIYIYYILYNRIYRIYIYIVFWGGDV